MLGRTISHYQVLEKLGAGGMGTVYRAFDKRLEREIALKVLTPEIAGRAEFLRRFEREAKSVAALNHPNIVTIYSVEEEEDIHFFTMELVQGVPLSALIGPDGLPPQRFLDIALAIVGAVAFAHEHGVVHRDLKPANVMIDEAGHAKVLDFGVARLLPEYAVGRFARESPTIPLTEAGTILGTPAYIAPELLRGKAADRRSDIFSLGVMLYEMATGRLPFSGNTSAELVSAILTAPHTPASLLNPNVPPSLGEILDRCLQKDPDLRPQSAAAVKEDLGGMRSTLETAPPPRPEPERRILGLRRRLAGGLGAALTGIAIIVSIVWSPLGDRRDPDSGGEAGKKRIVVLPFENLGSPEDDYFAGGITEEITSRLAAVDGLGVISRTSALQYAGSGKTTRQIGDELDVQYVLEGTVRWARSGEGPGRVRITPQLIEVAVDTHLWAEVYDRSTEDIFQVQSEIARRVVERLGVTLLERERPLIEARPTENLEAYHAYLQGRYAARQPHFTMEKWRRVVASYERAVELDPAFALAHAELAKAHASLYYHRHDLSASRLEKASIEMQLATSLDPDSPQVRIASGYYHLWAYRDYDRALAEIAEVEKQLPLNAEILEARASVYEAQGRLIESLALLDQAYRLSPRDASFPTWIALADWLLRRYPEGVKAADQAIALAPDQLWPHMTRGMIFWCWNGNLDEADVSLRAMEGIEDDWVVWFGYWQDVYAGRYESALDRLDRTPGDWVLVKMFALPKDLLRAQVFEIRGDVDRAAASRRRALKLLEDEIARQSQDPRLHSSLGVIYAHLGRREDALREMSTAIDLLPVSRDAVYGLTPEVDLAHVRMILGDEEAAIDQTERLLSIPSWISPSFLKMDPRWAPLRQNPRFQALLERPYSDFRK